MTQNSSDSTTFPPAAASVSAKTQVVFVFDDLPDWQTLVAGLPAGAEVVVLDGGQDGLAQMVQHLEGRSGIDALHIFSHGGQAQLTLGARVLDQAALAGEAEALVRIGHALGENGDILLYGCNLAEGEAGALFVSEVSSLTRGDVAASINSTGSSLLGGDWVLERHTGSIDAELVGFGDGGGYAHLLAAPTTETFDGVMVDGSGHSFGTPGQARVINGWTFSLLDANGALDTGVNSYVDVTNRTDESSLANDGSDHAALLNGSYAVGTGQAAAVLAASDGSEFAFQSIVVEQYMSGGADYRLVGYRNGSAVSGATRDFTAGAYPSGGTLVTVSGNAWQNLDEVRIVRQNGETDISIYVDDITVAAVVRPTATVVVADTALAAGETSLVTFTFSQAVTGFTNADLSIANGSLSAVSSSDGGITWTATFTPTASVTDTTNLIVLNMTGVAMVTTAATGTGTQNSNNYSIDTDRPTASIVVADNVLAAGETSGVTITFSEAVTGFDNTDLSIANGTLSAVSSSNGGVTWTATFTPTASITDATNVITLDNTGVVDAAGNAGSGTTNSNNYAIDGVRPTLASAITISDTALRIGDTATVTFTFTEAVSGFTTADVTVPNGSLSGLSSSDGGVTWTATLTPSASTLAVSNVLTLDYTGITDAAGNAGTGTATSGNYAVDTQRPTATVVVADAALTGGETSGVTITFSEAVTGFTNGDLSVANGTLSAVSSSDGGITWTATFTPAAGINDAANVITLDNTGVTDLAGNAGTGTTDSNNYTINTMGPTASIVVADAALTVGETSAVTITFSEAVTGFDNSDLTVANGTLSAVSSSDGGITWTATFTPTASITDATNVITLDNTGVTNAGSTAGTGTTNSNNYAIDTQRPTLASAITVSDTALRIGDTATVTFTFTEAVSGFTTADVTAPNGTLSGLSSSDGGITWTATLTPSASTTDASNVLTLDYTGITDAAGNAGTGTATSGNYAVDTQRPTATVVVADSALTAGETSLVTITFSEAVSGFTNADLTVANGTLSAVSSSDGGITWTTTLTPTASVNDGSNLITLDNNGVVDLVGNAGTGSTDSNNYAVNTVRPTASIVVADTALAAGETSAVTITFSEAVTGFDNTDLSVANGTLSAVSSSDGGITWTATFTPTAGITDTTNIITLDNTGVANAGGNTGTGTTDSNNYAIDTARPTATVVVADTALAIGETSGVTITFSEAVTGFTNGDLSVANGTLSAVSSSDGGITWTATLTPTAGITDATNLITLDNTGVADAAGNAGTGTTDSNNYAVDAVAPVLASATVNGNQLVLTYTEAATLDATNAPATTDFAVAVGATANTVTAVAVNAAAKTVTLTLTTAVVAGQAVTVAYTDPTAGNDANAIQDAAGNDAASFAATPATNLTPAIPDPDPEPTPPTPVPPTPPTPGVPDNDGIPPTVEDQAPGIPGPGGNTTPGDGNGDGIKDSEQPSVGSVGFVLSPTGESNPGSAPPTFTTLVASSQNGKVGSGNDNSRITSLTQKDAPADAPAGLQTPIGLVSFTVELAPGKTSESFSLYLDPALGVNGYWKQDASGTWVNLASEPYGGKVVTEGGRTRLDFQITDGGQFDADGKADGIITDPGAPGHMPLSIVGLAPDMPQGFWF